MTITGELFIGNRRIGGAPTFEAVNPATGETLHPTFTAANTAAVERACALAWSVFDRYRECGSELRAQFLETIAARILDLGDELLERAHAETGLPLARLTGERARTVGQLRLFAEELRRRGWLGIRVDPAIPDRKPAPRPDLRLRNVPLGPVVVFGASNFPLAFSVAGGDTAAALAAGCPVIVKGHPAHPGTSELVAGAIVAAVEACRLPPGVFALLNGDSRALGAALVAHPQVKAVGFTGSRTGGLALMKIASERPEPIPFYAEMSSINPVVLLPDALATRAIELGKEFVASLTLGVGQFCTNPGLLIALDGADLERFIAAAGEAFRQVVPAPMLTPGIHRAYDSGVDRLLAHAQVVPLARGGDSAGKHCGRGALFSIDAQAALRHPEVLEEVFGPSSILIRCRDVGQMAEVLESLEGQLTATLHLSGADEALAGRLMPVLERKAGRILANGWPTGVEVAHAMVHGGPFPATSDGRSTSVGTLAIERFLRPVCYQDMPDALLPAVLQRSLAIALAACFFVLGAPKPAGAVDMRRGGDEQFVYIGTRGDSGPGPVSVRPPAAAQPARAAIQGIYAVRLNSKTGQLSLVGVAAGLPRATWLSAHPSLPVIYAAVDSEGGPGADSDILSFRLDPSTGELQLLGKVNAGGRDATVMYLDPASNALLVGNHGTGSVTSFPVLADGRLGPMASVQRDYGSGPTPRQKTASAHGVAVDPSHRYVLVADFGADRIFTYRFNARTQELSPTVPPFEALPAGSGPRHLMFDPNGHFLILDTELTAELRSYGWDAKRGRLRLAQTLSAYPPDHAGEKSAAEVAMSRDGRFVYLSLRGDQDCIVVFAFDPKLGTMKEIQRISTHGKTPWSFGIDPTGHWMLVTNEGSDSLVELKVDAATGLLESTAESVEIPKPVTVAFSSRR